jgi:hypothetical protein
LALKSGAPENGTNIWLQGTRLSTQHFC